MGTINLREGLLSLEAAAGRLSCTGVKILLMIKHGVLEGVEDGNNWLVYGKSLEDLEKKGIKRNFEQKRCITACSVCSSGCR